MTHFELALCVTDSDRMRILKYKKNYKTKNAHFFLFRKVFQSSTQLQSYMKMNCLMGHQTLWSTDVHLSWTYIADLTFTDILLTLSFARFW